MSRIRIETGSAEVILEAREVTYADSTLSHVVYAPDDLIAATLAALRAIGDTSDRYGNPGRSQQWIAAIGKANETL